MLVLIKIIKKICFQKRNLLTFEGGICDFVFYVPAISDLARIKTEGYMSHLTFSPRRAGVSIAALGAILFAPAAMAAVPNVVSLGEAVHMLVPHYDTVVYGPGVNRGKAVIIPSRRHGWQNDLTKALSFTGLTYTVSGHTVRIEKTGDTGTQATQSAEQSSNGYSSSGFQMMSYSAPPAPAKPQVADTGLDIVPYHQTKADKAGKPTDATKIAKPSKPALVAAKPVETTAPAPAPAKVAAANPVVKHTAPEKVSHTFDPVNRYIPPPPPVTHTYDQQVWVLRVNTPVAQDIKQWGKEAGWDVRWNMSETPIMSRTMSFTGSFKQAVSTVIESLHQRGINIHVAFWNYVGGSTAVISGTSDTQD